VKLRTLLLTHLAAGAVGAALFAWWVHPPPPATISPQTTKELSERGFVPQGPEPPVVRDAPKGTTPRMTVSGGIPYLPAKPLEFRVVPKLGVCPQWVLTPDDLSGDCSAEVLEAGGKHFARLTWTARARTPHGEVTRGPETVRDVAFSWQDSPPTLRRQIELRVGVSSEPALVAGFSLYRADHRLGWWVEASSRPTLSGGLALRF
jgi:hypothetical protein